MAANENDLIGIYERTIGAGIDRIWENVRDWEHLPWLHAGTFEDVNLIEESDSGWTADVVFAGGDTSRTSVALEVEKLRYTTSTLSGDVAGSDIVTVLRPKSANSTDIEVSFHLPGVSDADRPGVFEIYRDLYARLWDEDETMMRERQSFLDERDAGPGAKQGPAAIELGDKTALLETLPRIVTLSGKSFRLIELSGEIVAHSVRCPHLAGPLGDVDCVEGVLTCPWHGYRFEARSGKCVSGQAFRLATPPRVSIDEDTGVVRVFFAG